MAYHISMHVFIIYLFYLIYVLFFFAFRRFQQQQASAKEALQLNGWEHLYV